MAFGRARDIRSHGVVEGLRRRRAAGHVRARRGVLAVLGHVPLRDSAIRQVSPAFRGGRAEQEPRHGSAGGTGRTAAAGHSSGCGPASLHGIARA